MSGSSQSSGAARPSSSTMIQGRPPLTGSAGRRGRCRRADAISVQQRARTQRQPAVAAPAVVSLAQPCRGHPAATLLVQQHVEQREVDEQDGHAEGPDVIGQSILPLVRARAPWSGPRRSGSWRCRARARWCRPTSWISLTWVDRRVICSLVVTPLPAIWLTDATVESSWVSRASTSSMVLVTTPGSSMPGIAASSSLDHVRDGCQLAHAAR